MEGLSFQDVQSFSQSWGAIYFSVLFVIVCIYALWPANKAKFDKAASMPLHDDDEVAQ